MLRTCLSTFFSGYVLARSGRGVLTVFLLRVSVRCWESVCMFSYPNGLTLQYNFQLYPVRHACLARADSLGLVRARRAAP